MLASTQQGCEAAQGLLPFRFSKTHILYLFDSDFKMVGEKKNKKLREASACSVRVVGLKHLFQ